MVGFGQSATYSHDNNGNLIADTGKKINNISYNSLNLPTNISLQNGNIELIYDASGRKWLKKVVNSQTNTTDTYSYVNGIEYKNGNLQAIYNEVGRIIPDEKNGYLFEYTISEHLGNARPWYESGPKW